MTEDLQAAIAAAAAAELDLRRDTEALRIVQLGRDEARKRVQEAHDRIGTLIAEAVASHVAEALA